jgi:ABC-type antimicrobial peptide transport system permease subunit
VGKEIVVHGSPFRVVGVLAPLMIYDQGTYMDANGILVPLEAFMDRLQPARRLDSVTVKLRATRDLPEVTALLLSRARQAHHGVEDLEVKNLDAEAARSYQGFLKQMRNLKFVLFSLAGTVLLVGGVGVLSVMLIASSERRFEIGLRKALGASDRMILLQFMLEAGVLGALGALAGTLAGALVCQALSPRFPYGLVVNPAGLALAWATALALALGFGLYPALRAMRLSPMEAMR